MIRKKIRSSDSGNQDAWLISYSDVMTILFAFFVIIAAISEVDQSKYDEFRETFAESMNKSKETSIHKEILDKKKIQQNIEQMIQEKNLKEKVELKANSLGLKLVFPSKAFFDTGDAELKQEFQSILDDIMNILKTAGYQDYYLAVQGHTDDVPIRTERFPSNWELSAARSGSVANYLITLGLAPYRVKVSGFADTRPAEKILPGDAPEILRDKRAKNRRIEIQVNYYKDKF